jgi:hypothetical protein
VELLRNRIARTWLLLVVATLCSFVIFESSGGNPRNQAIVGGFVIAIAFFKVRLIGLNFMEIRGCPAWMRSAFELWVITIGAALIIMQ